jgi:hypothetical protein
MAGQTDNTDILAALNQQIQAINDLITGVSTLVNAVAGLTLECNNNVECRPSVSPMINVTCGGVTGGSQFGADSGVEGGTPPGGYEPPSEQTENRKCKAANAVTWTVREVCENLYDAGVQQYAGLGAALVGGLVGAVLGSAAPPFGTLVGAVLGVVAGVTAAIVGGGLQLSEMASAIDGNPGAFVCALYTTNAADDARDAFIAAMGEEITLNSASSAFLGLVLSNNLTNLLFFTYSDETEQAIDEVEILFSCTACAGNATEFHFTADPEGFFFADSSQSPCSTEGEWGNDSPTDPYDDAGHLYMAQHHGASGFCWAAWHYIYTDGPVINENTVMYFDRYFAKVGSGRLQIAINDDQSNQALVEAGNPDEWYADTFPVGQFPALDGNKVHEIIFALDQGSQGYDSWVSIDRVVIEDVP